MILVDEKVLEAMFVQAYGGHCASPQKRCDENKCKNDEGKEFYCSVCVMEYIEQQSAQMMDKYAICERSSMAEVAANIFSKIDCPSYCKNNCNTCTDDFAKEFIKELEREGVEQNTNK